MLMRFSHLEGKKGGRPMDKTIVPLGEFERAAARDWEGEILRQVCEQGQNKAWIYLAELEEKLYAHRSAS